MPNASDFGFSVEGQLPSTDGYPNTTYLAAYEAFEPLYAALDEARVIAKAEAGDDPEKVKAALMKHNDILMLLIKAKEKVEDRLYNL